MHEGIMLDSFQYAMAMMSETHSLLVGDKTLNRFARLCLEA